METNQPFNTSLQSDQNFLFQPRLRNINPKTRMKSHLHGSPGTRNNLTPSRNSDLSFNNPRMHYQSPMSDRYYQFRQSINGSNNYNPLGPHPPHFQKDAAFMPPSPIGNPTPPRQPSTPAPYARHAFPPNLNHVPPPPLNMRNFPPPVIPFNTSQIPRQNTPPFTNNPTELQNTVLSDGGEPPFKRALCASNGTSNVEESQIDLVNSAASSLQTDDQMWVWQRFRKRRISADQQKQKQEESVSLADVNTTLCKVLPLLNALKEKERTLEEHLTSTTFPWEDVLEESTASVQSATSLIDRLSKEQFLEKATKQIQRAEKRKKYRERRKMRRYLEFKDKEKAREEISETIDEWQNAIFEKLRREKQENQLKKAADETMSEVRRKLVDVDKILRLLTALEQLRRLRKDAAARKGLRPPEEADETFAKITKEVRTFTKKQRKVYVGEQKTLQVMLETEQEESREREKARKQEKQRVENQKERDEACLQLFGRPGHRINEVSFNSQYYNQAQYNVDNFIKIRMEWDRYLVPESSAFSSSIPAMYVEPPSPSSDVWKSALDKS